MNTVQHVDGVSQRHPAKHEQISSLMRNEVDPELRLLTMG
jgi:hypothetical protein